MRRTGHEKSRYGCSQSYRISQVFHLKRATPSIMIVTAAAVAAGSRAARPRTDWIHRCAICIVAVRTFLKPPVKRAHVRKAPPGEAPSLELHLCVKYTYLSLAGIRFTSLSISSHCRRFFEKIQHPASTSLRCDYTRLPSQSPQQHNVSPITTSRRNEDFDTTARDNDSPASSDQLQLLLSYYVNSFTDR